MLSMVSVSACHEAVPVRISVPTPGAEVWVVRPWWHTSHLGTGPLTLASGAHVGDTVEVKDRGRTYEETIQFGEPGGERTLVPR